MKNGALVFVLGAFAGVTACGRDSGQVPESEPEQLAEGGTAVVGTAAGPTSLLPPFAGVALDFEIGGWLYLALNYGIWEDGGLSYPQGHDLALARAWDQEGRRLTYSLNTEHRWSDGQPIRAADVVFTYGLLADPELGLPLSAAASRIDSVVAVDDSTVTFHFEIEYPGMLFDTGVGILPAHVYESMPPAEMPAYGADLPEGAQLVVSGPFQLEMWQPGERIVLARNPEALTQPRLDRVAFQILPDETTRLAALRAGEVNAAEVGSFHAVSRLVGEPGYQIERMPQRGYDYIAWNPGTHPAFADARVRHALSLAIDRRVLIESLQMSGFAEPAHGPYGSLFTQLVPVISGPLYDPEQAGLLLDASGWVDSDQDGVRDHQGFDLEFELVTTSGNDRREDAAEIIQSQLSRIGVRANIVFQELGSLFARAQARDYEALLMGWQVGLDPDISFFWADSQSPVNFVAYDNPRVTALIDTALESASASEAAPYWQAAAGQIAADYPYAFLWFFDQILAVGPSVGGVDVDAVGYTRSLHRWGRRAAATD